MQDDGSWAKVTVSVGVNIAAKLAFSVAFRHWAHAFSTAVKRSRIGTAAPSRGIITQSRESTRVESVTAVLFTEHLTGTVVLKFSTGTKSGSGGTGGYLAGCCLYCCCHIRE